MAAVTPDASSWSKRLEQLLQGRDLSAPEASSLMQAWLAEELSPVQTGAFLAALRAKGMVADELAAMAFVLREACPLPCDRPNLRWWIPVAPEETGLTPSTFPQPWLSRLPPSG
jgi:anthranilate phosphoribosyltransferase